MEYLNKYFSGEMISKIEDEIDSSYLYTLENNEYSVSDNIEYFKSLGITNIVELLIYNPNIFIRSKDKNEKFFLEHNIQELVEGINDDASNIDLFM